MTRHLIMLLLLSTILLIENAQSVALSSQLPLKTPNSANPSDSMTTTTLTATSNQSVIPNLSAWRGAMSGNPAQQAGCFAATYPSTNWQPTQCITAPQLPLLPYEGGSTTPSTVGNGNDEVAYSSSNLIGSSVGSFQESGLTSETDSIYGPNNYGLQVNSQFFTTSTTYTGGKSTLGWEQFVWINWPYSNSVGYEYIQYWLIGYQTSYGSCPSTGPPGGSPWLAFSTTDCYANSPGVPTPLEAPTNLGSLILGGLSNYNHAGNDVDMFCISGSCYDVTITDQIVNLYQNWRYSESNVFGTGNGSEANYNSGTSITVANTLKDQSGNVIVPSCVNTGYTGETNNLNLGSCSSNSNGQIVFTESNLPSVTLVTGVDAGQGSVSPDCPNPSGCSENVGSSQQVTANPSSGWQFSSWSTISGIQPSSCSGNSCNFNMPNNQVTLRATFTQLVALSNIGPDVVSGGVDSAWVVMPDYTGGASGIQHNSLQKCGGVFVAFVTDVYAATYFYGALTNTQNEILDTNSGYVSQSSSSCGQPTTSVSQPVVAVAGPAANMVVHYYESTSSPLYYNYGTGCITRRDTGACLDHSGATLTSDVFVMEAFNDPAGRTVFVIYGRQYPGTLAGLEYLVNFVLKNNPSAYTASWYVYSWKDAASGVSANSIPDPGDTYVQLASGP